MNIFKRINEIFEDEPVAIKTPVTKVPKQMGTSPLNNKSYVAEIANIHKSFASALNKMKTDKEQATKTAPAAPSDDERINTLESMGFKANPTVLKHKADKENHQMGVQLIENFENKLTWAEHYMLKYPNYKFITHDLVLELCKKYGLVIAPANKFKSVIPDSNIDAMIKFKKEFNADDACIRLKEKYYDRHMFDMYKFGAPAKDYQRKAIIDGKYHVRYDKGFQYEDGSIYLSASNSNDNLERVFETYSSNRSKSNYVGVKGGIRMVANSHMFNVEKWEEFDEKTHELVTNQKKWLELDPIMLMPVYTDLKIEEEGYLIITAWGDEASDPDVINERMN